MSLDLHPDPSAPTKMEKITLTHTSPHFSRLEYRLKLLLQSTTATIISVDQISNPTQTLQFERKAKVRCFVSFWLFLRGSPSWFSRVGCRAINFPTSTVEMSWCDNFRIHWHYQKMAWCFQSVLWNCQDLVLVIPCQVRNHSSTYQFIPSTRFENNSKGGGL